MSAPELKAVSYALGHALQVLARLERQAAMFERPTRALLERCGIGAGQRVLDLGCGAGVVTLLAAGVVGLGGVCSTTQREARSPDDVAVVRGLILEYQASLGVDLAFQHFADEIASLATTYGPPARALLLATVDGVPAGCVGVRPLTPGCCEMKRLYVRPAARGQHLGRHLAEGALAAARALGYTHMRLDTLPTMQGAQALYLALGCYEIAPYRENPVAGTRDLEAAL